MKDKLDPRSIWLQKRIDDCIDEIKNAREYNNFYEYRSKLRELVIELDYVCNEWMKYYPGHS